MNKTLTERVQKNMTLSGALDNPVDSQSRKVEILEVPKSYEGSMEETFTLGNGDDQDANEEQS